jgi:hypothetical protein
VEILAVIAVSNFFGFTNVSVIIGEGHINRDKLQTSYTVVYAIIVVVIDYGLF